MTYNPNHLANANAQAAASMRSAGIGSVGGKPITSTAAQIQRDFMKEFRKRDDDKPSGLGVPTTKVEPEEDDRNLDQKIYDFFVGAGADMEPKKEEPMYMMDFYGGPMFVVPEPAPVERQVLSSPFDEYNVETYNFGGYSDTRDTSPSIGSTVDPDLQDPRRGLMAAPTMSQPSTPEELTDVPRALAMSAAVPTKTYTIKSGDTLSEIARDNNTTVKALMTLNTQIEKADEIDAGAKIEIPVTPTGFEGMGPDPSTGKPVQGLMSQTFDTDLPAFGINSREFNDGLLNELVDLEGRGGDFLSSTPTYDLGITESKANEYDLDPDDYESFGEFAADFTDKYVDEKYEENKNLFAKVDAENHTALMSYLWNLGSFGRNQKEALKNNDMREYIAETKDAVGSEGYSSSGLSARRAKEANLIGENLDNWNPITKVKITGTRANPTFTWEDANGNIVEQYTTTRDLHPANVPNKPNANDVLDEEIVL